MDVQQQENASLIYTALVPDATAKEWLEATHKDLLVQRWLEGKLVVPGHSKHPCSNMSHDACHFWNYKCFQWQEFHVQVPFRNAFPEPHRALAARTQAPCLREGLPAAAVAAICFVWCTVLIHGVREQPQLQTSPCQDHDGKVAIVHFPEADIKTWWTHERFGAEFQGLSQALGNKYGTLAELESAKEARKAAPKRAQTSGSSVPTPKKVKIEAEACKLGEMKNTELRTAPRYHVWFLEIVSGHCCGMA